MTSLEMTIIEKFNFEDGRTVFAVAVNGEEYHIPTCYYDLVIDNQKVDELFVEGEVLINNKGQSPYKAVATSDSQKLTHFRFESGKWKLRLSENQKLSI